MNSGSKPAPVNRGFDDVELAGSLVRLRTTRAADAERAFELVHGNQHILRWLIWNGPAGTEELAQTYGLVWPQELRDGLKYPFAIEELARPGLIGCIDARLFDHPRQFEVGYWLGEPYWGKGYATEALSLICHLCFTHLGAMVIEGGAFKGNRASRRVLEKSGFSFDGTLRRAVCKNEEWIDLWHATVLREEWEARKFRPVSERLVPHTPPPVSDAPAE